MTLSSSQSGSNTLRQEPHSIVRRLQIETFLDLPPLLPLARWNVFFPPLPEFLWGPPGKLSWDTPSQSPALPHEKTEPHGHVWCSGCQPTRSSSQQPVTTASHVSVQLWMSSPVNPSDDKSPS